MDSNKIVPGLLCFDFDGTLYSHIGRVKGKPVSSECIQFMESLVHRGWIWGINTGRSFDLLMQDLGSCGFISLPSFIVSREREVQFFDETENRYRIDEAWKKECTDIHSEMYDREAEMLAKVQKFVEGCTEASWISEPGDEAGVIASSIEEMEEILDFVDAELKSVEGVEYLRSTIYMRFTHIDYHKGTSLRHVAEHFAVPKSSVFSVGDGENDLGMLDKRYSDLIACPSNAVKVVQKHVREQGGYVANSEVSNGVTEALKYYFSL